MQNQDATNKSNVELNALVLIVLAFGAGTLAVINPGGQIHSLEASKKFQQVVELCDQSLKNPLYASDPTIYFERGFAKRNLGDYAGAITDQQEALKLRKQNWLMWGFDGFGAQHHLDHNFYLELGKNYLEKSDLPKAQESLEQALKVEKSMEAYQNLGLVHEKSNDFAKAEIAFNDAVAQAGSSEKEIALHNRALLYWRNKKLDQALKDLQQGLDISSCAEANSAKGYIYIERLEYKKAIDEFNKSLETSQSAVAYHGRALAEMEDRSLLQAAAKDLDRAIQLDPSSEECKKDKQLVLEKLQAAQKK